MNSIVQAFMYR